jgi:RNA polymerase sigma-70 factor (ECF subfamily)
VTSDTASVAENLAIRFHEIPSTRDGATRLSGSSTQIGATSCVEKSDNAAGKLAGTLQEEIRIPYGERSDLDLLASLSTNGPDAYAEIHRRHAASVTSAARKILVNEQHIQDVVADVFAGLWFFPEKFDPSRGSLDLFLRMRARGRCIELIRAEAARRRREMIPHDYAVIIGDADAILIQSEAALVVRDAVSQLPRKERDPIYLAFFGGLKYQEVASRLNLPEGTAKSRIRAGLRRLRENDGLLVLHSFDDVSP